MLVDKENPISSGRLSITISWHAAMFLFLKLFDDETEWDSSVRKISGSCVN